MPASSPLYQPYYNQSWAIVIGVNAYTHLLPLRYAVNDARHIAEALRASCGFLPENILVLEDVAATRTEIMTNFWRTFTNESSRRVGPDDRVLFFFAGHGLTRTFARGSATQKESGYLALANATGPEDWGECLSLDDLLKEANYIPAKHILFLFDACFSGLSITRSTPVLRQTRDLLTHPAVQVITAGTAGQQVSDGAIENSPFTTHITAALRGAAASDGWLTATGLFQYVRERVTSEPGAIQTPQYNYVSGSGDMVFTFPNSRQLPEEVLTLSESPSPRLRALATDQLAVLLYDKNPELAQLARAELTRLRDDPMPSVRVAAREALEEIDGRSMRRTKPQASKGKKKTSGQQKKEVEAPTTPPNNDLQVERLEQLNRPTPSSPPIATFITTYTLGDDIYDDSFSIDSPDGEFLGECGIGISEATGVPKKIVAFEIWVFDKNDIRTVTIVLMSARAFTDKALKERLSVKGTPALLETGEMVSLETATLVVTARAVNVVYVKNSSAPYEYFRQLSIELIAYSKRIKSRIPASGAPTVVFTTTYRHGDDLYDDSFVIDDQEGGFWGECGVGISETIGLAPPKKVLAFDVWVFDKNDIRTATKVLLSKRAFADSSLRNRLAAKGEPVSAEIGDVILLDTATLVISARIIDLVYAEMDSTSDAFFERLTIQLAVYPKKLTWHLSTPGNQ